MKWSNEKEINWKLQKKEFLDFLIYFFLYCPAFPMITEYYL